MRIQGAVAALTLTACTDQAPAPPTTAATTARPAPPTASTAPTPTPSATSAALPDVTVPPDPPQALNGPANEDSAEAVARYFMSLFPYMLATGDTTAWRELSGESCGYCSRVTGKVADAHAAGRHDEGGQLEFTFGSAMDFADGTFFATIGYVEHPSVTKDAAGEVLEEFDGETIRAEIDLEWRDGRWLIQGVNPNLVEE